jgi:site-specific recombinase XerD
MSQSEPILIQADERGEAIRWAGAFLAGFKSPETRRSYRRDLDCWFAFCAAHDVHPYRGLRRTHVEVYLRETRSTGAGPSERDVVPTRRHAQFVVSMA